MSVESDGNVVQELRAKTKNDTAIYGMHEGEWKLIEVVSNPLFTSWETIGQTIVNPRAIEKLELYESDDKDPT